MKCHLHPNPRAARRIRRRIADAKGMTPNPYLVVSVTCSNAACIEPAHVAMLTRQIVKEFVR